MFFFLMSYYDQKQKMVKKGEEALRSYPFNVDKKMHPVARGLVGGKDDDEVKFAG